MTKWQEVNLGDVCKININNYSEIDGYRYVNYLDTGNITQNKIETIQKIDLSSDKLPVRAKRKAVLNDIVYSTVRPNQLHYGIIREKIENFLVSTGFTVISVDTEIAIPIYVYYYIIQPRITESMQAIAEQSVSAYPSIKPSDLAKIKIFLPPLNIQKKIAGVLGALDDKIELNNKINQNLEAQAQALFKSWFIDFEPFGGKMPNDWKIGKLGDIAEIIMGQSPDGSTYNEEKNGIPFFQGRAEFSFRFPSLRLFTTLPKRTAKKGDILMSVRAPVGDLNVALFECCIGRGLSAIREKNLRQSFLYYLLNFEKKQLNVFNGEGTVFGSINKNGLRNLTIIIPTSKHIDHFEKIVTPIDAQIETLSQENVRLAELRDTLLPKLMNGEIDVDNVKID